MGVGRLTLIDRDIVELSNLQRQCLFSESDVGQPKAVAAERRVREVNSGVRVERHVSDLNYRNVARLLSLDAEPPSVILDGLDNFEARLLLNDVAVSRGIPYIYTGVVGTTGMVMPIVSREGACLRCIVDGSPAPGESATCDTVGVLSAAVQVAAGLAVGEASKILVGRSDLVDRSLRSFNLWDSTWRRLDSSGLRHPECPCCIKREYTSLAGRDQSAVTSLCGSDSVQVLPPEGAPVVRDLAALAESLAAAGIFEVSQHMVRGELFHDSVERGAPLRLTVFADGRAIIHGTSDRARARSIVSRLLGV